MGKDWFAEHAPTPDAPKTDAAVDWFAAQAPPAAPAAPAAVVEEVPGGVGGALTEFGGGVKQGLGDIYGMVRHPIDTAEALWGLVESSPALIERLAQKDTRSEALPALLQGAAEAQVGATVEEARRSPWRAAGRFTGSVAIPGAVVKGGVKLARLRRAASAAETAAEAQAATRVTGTGVPGGAVDVPPQQVGRIRLNVPVDPPPPPRTRVSGTGAPVAAVQVPPQGVGTIRLNVQPSAAPTNVPLMRVSGTGAPAAGVHVPTQPPGQMRMNVRVPEPTPPPPPPPGPRLVRTPPERPPLQPPNTNVNTAIEQALSEVQTPPPAPPPPMTVPPRVPPTAVEPPVVPPRTLPPELPESWKPLVQEAAPETLPGTQAPTPEPPPPPTTASSPTFASREEARALASQRNVETGFEHIVAEKYDGSGFEVRDTGNEIRNFPDEAYQSSTPVSYMHGQRPAPPLVEPPSANLDAVRKALDDPAPPAAGVDIQSQPGMGLDPDVVTTFRQGLGGGDLADARRAVGSEKAARSLDEIAADLGVDRSVVQQMMRDTTDGPSRRPMAADLAEMDNDYLRRIMDPSGSVSGRTALTMGAAAGGGLLGADAAKDGNPLAGALIGALGGAALTNPAQALKAVQAARVTGMLSGAAVPKSAAGNLGAVLTAAAENQSLAPLREAMNLGENVKNFRQGWQTQANPAGVSGLSRFNVFGRTMGALDEATTKLLQRSGLTLQEAQRLLLTSPNPLGHGSLGRGLESAPGRFFFPFQRTPINSVSEGLDSLIGAIAKPGSGPGAIKRGLTYGAGAAGAAAGTQTDNPLALAVLAALAGPRALPFALGAGATAGPQVIERVGVGLPEGSYKDLFDPLRSINKPALMKLLESGGR